MMGVTAENCWLLSQAMEKKSRENGVLIAELKVCSNTKNLERGKEIHAEAIYSGNDSSVYVGTALVKMYANCKSMSEARQVFDGIKHPDVVSWNTLILGYAGNEEGDIALKLFEKMTLQGYEPTSLTYVAALKACISLALQRDESGRALCLELGKQIHSTICCDSDIYVENTLIDMYRKCGSITSARSVFDGIRRPDVASWTGLILGYAEEGEGIIALDLFARMKYQGCIPNSFTCVAALKACTSLVKQDGSGRAECLMWGKQIHAEIGCNSNTFVENTLIEMYAKCGSTYDARQVFDCIKLPNVVSWTTLILGYAEKGEGSTALGLFARMRSEDCKPDSYTCVAALKACTSLALQHDVNGRPECLQLGKQLQSIIGCCSNIHVQNTLLDMYAKCGSMEDARQVFDGLRHLNVVSWSSLILGYSENGEGVTALNILARMKHQGYAPSSITYLAAIKACISLKKDTAECQELGKQLHAAIGCHSDIYVKNTLIDMYAKCGNMTDALCTFDGIKRPDVVSWNVLMLGYVDSGECISALDLFRRMRLQGYSPDSVTFVAVLKACALLGALDYGSKVHACAELNSGIELNVIVVTSLVDFYSKCGSMEDAQKVFDLHSGMDYNLTTWNALLAGYSRLGDTKATFRLLREMQDRGFRPDEVTFLGILACCSHAGLVEKAREYFEAMSTIYGITPTSEHYNCMVHIFGRSNKIDDAIKLLRRMPCIPGTVAWMTILSACRQWKNVEIGKVAFDALLSLNDPDAAAYVLMADIYGSKGMWREGKMVLEMRKNLKSNLDK